MRHDAWSASDVAILKRLWKEGKTATEISEALFDKSRSAILGKARRIKLPMRRGDTVPRPPKKVAAVKKDKPDLQRIPETTISWSARKDTCAWIYGEPHSHSPCCANPAIDGTAYCLFHKSVTRQKFSPLNEDYYATNV